MSFKQKARRYLFSEESIFVYLWVALFLVPVLSGRGRNELAVPLIHLIFTGSYIVMTVINNYVLIPRYLTEGKYLKYFGWAAAIILLFAFIEEFAIEHFMAESKRAEATLRGLGFAVFKLVFIMGLFSAYKLMWDYQQRQQRLKQLEREKIESELKFLKSQISPHVLFNNLNNIYSYALEGSPKTPEMIMKLSELMRYMLYEAREKWVPLEKEVQYLNDFIKLQEIRLEDRGDVAFNVEGSLENRLIAPLLLVAFVENSFKHGMAVHGEKVYIRIDVAVEGNTLYFKTVNSSKSKNRSPEQLDEERGIGLKNVKKRLELLYPDRHTLNFEQDTDRFYVSLKIDL
jgi:LytS/YehU family sensor histidine kinase